MGRVAVLGASAASSVAAVVLLAGPVAAQAYPGGTQQPSQVLGQQVFNSPGGSSPASGGTLAFTGLELFLIVATALALVAVGTVIYRMNRRSAS